MKIRGLVVTAVVACAVGWAGRSVFSGDEPKAPPGGMDEMWKAAAKPGEEHARMIKALEGDWTVHEKFWEQGKLTESDGTASFKALLGGRYVQQDFHGEMNKEPYDGRGIMGYDNNTKRYFDFWFDSTGTGFMSGTGQETEKGKAWAFKDSMSTPMGPKSARSEMKVISDKEFTFSMYMAMGGPEALAMELTYKRK